MSARVVIAAIAIATLAGCSDGGNVSACACTISVVDCPQTAMLMCGEEACLCGELFGCDTDNVLTLGRCGDDFAVGDSGACVSAGQSCEPAGPACCATSATPDDAGPPSPSCDPASLRCCLPAGSPCTSSGACCAGQSCLPFAGGLRCSS